MIVALVSMYQFGLVLSAIFLPLRGLPWPQRLEINPRWRGQLAYTATYHYGRLGWQVYTVNLVQDESLIYRRLADSGYLFA